MSAPRPRWWTRTVERCTRSRSPRLPHRPHVPRAADRLTRQPPGVSFPAIRGPWSGPMLLTRRSSPSQFPVSTRPVERRPRRPNRSWIQPPHVRSSSIWRAGDQLADVSRSHRRRRRDGGRRSHRHRPWPSRVAAVTACVIGAPGQHTNRSPSGSCASMAERDVPGGEQHE